MIPDLKCFELVKKQEKKAEWAEKKKRLNNAGLLTKAYEEAGDRKIQARRSVSINDKKKLSYTDFRELSNFVPLLTDTQEDLATLARLYGEGAGLKTGDDKTKTTYAAMDIMTDRIMEIKPGIYDLSSDQALVRNAAGLEEMVSAVGSYRGFLSKNPDYVDHMLKQKHIDGTNKALAVFKKLEILAAISEYYRLRKLVITDDIYAQNDSNSRSYEEEKGDSPQVKRLKKMMRASYQAAKNLQVLFGDAKFDELKSKQGEDEIAALKHSSLAELSGNEEEKAADSIREYLAGLAVSDKFIKKLEAERLFQAPAWIQDALSLDVKRVKESHAEYREYTDLLEKLSKTEDEKEKKRLEKRIEKHPKHNFTDSSCLLEQNTFEMFEHMLSKGGTSNDVQPREDVYDRFHAMGKNMPKGIWGASPVFEGGEDKRLEKIAVSDSWNRIYSSISGPVAYRKTLAEMEEMIEILSIQKNAEEWEKIKKDPEAAVFYESAFKEMSRKIIYAEYAASRRIAETVAAKMMLLHPTDLAAQMTPELHSAVLLQGVISNVCLKEQKELLKDLYAEDGENAYQLDVDEMYKVSDSVSGLNFKIVELMKGMVCNINPKEYEKNGLIFDSDFYRSVVLPAFEAAKKKKEIPERLEKVSSESVILEWFFNVDPALMSKDIVHKKTAGGEFILQESYGRALFNYLVTAMDEIPDIIKTGKLPMPSDEELNEYEAYLKKEGYPPVRYTNEDDQKKPEELIKLDETSSVVMKDIIKKRRDDPYAIRLIKGGLEDIEYTDKDGKKKHSEMLI